MSYLHKYNNIISIMTLQHHLSTNITLIHDIGVIVSYIIY